MKHSAEHDRFTSLVDQVLSVSHDEIKRREAEYKKNSNANPHKRGPKRKAVKHRASRVPGA
jgi:hypothetical protein